MKFKDYLIIGLAIALVVGFFIYDNQTGKLQKKLSDARELTPDTVTVTIHLIDTVYQEVPATVVKETTDTIRVGDTLIVYKWPILQADKFSQPLFDLTTSVDTREKKFSYEITYKPFGLRLEFTDKYNLKKGLKVTTVPPDLFGEQIQVDWGGYEPLRKKKGLRFSIGGGYGKEMGAFILGDLSWKKHSVGALLQEGGYGVYYKRTLIDW